MNYGLPYMGSKNAIVEWVISKMPKAENFYDLFCGGCAITHGALVTNKFKNIHANDINPFSLLFLDAIKGKYKNENRWISRQDFERLKDKDPYVAMCWSFGNNKEKGYLYSPENERIKHALWNAIMFNDYSLAEEYNIPFKRSKYTDPKKRRLDIMHHWKKIIVPRLKKRLNTANDDRAISLERLERLQNLQSLESLERLQSLESFTMSTGNYFDVEIKPDSIIYCDIPYRGTEEYSNSFNHEKFYEWARQQEELLLISEYTMPKDFICVARRTKQCALSATNNSLKHVECLFIPSHQKGLYEQRTGIKLN